MAEPSGDSGEAVDALASDLESKARIDGAKFNVHAEEFTPRNRQAGTHDGPSLGSQEQETSPRHEPHVASLSPPRYAYVEEVSWSVQPAMNMHPAYISPEGAVVGWRHNNIWHLTYLFYHQGDAASYLF